MEPNLYHLRIPPDLARAAGQVAAQRGTTIGQMLRDLLAAEVAASKTPANASKTDVPPVNKEQLGKLFDGASGWSDLLAKLRTQGFSLQAAGNGLAVHRLSDQARLFRTGSIGRPYQALVSRFGAPFPNHPHTWMAERVLARDKQPQKRLNHVINDVSKRDTTTERAQEAPVR